MSSEIKFEVDTSSIVPVDVQLERLSRGLARGTLVASRIFQGKLRVATTAGPVIGRTGTLARSWGTSPVEVRAGGTRGGAISADKKKGGARVPYADILDKGGVVRPEHGRFLAIPIFDAVTPKGVTRAAFADGPRAAPGRLGRAMFFFRGKSGSLYFGAQYQRKLKAFYVLKPQVRIEGRHYKEAAFNAGKADALKVFQKIVEALVRSTLRADAVAALAWD